MMRMMTVNNFPLISTENNFLPISTGWNDKIIAQDDMIPFSFNENRFSFLVADHLLVGQLCTNPKSDRSLVSCLKVTQCSTSEIGDAPLYKSCTLPIQVMTTGPLPAPSKCKSGLPRITEYPATVMVFGVVSSEGHIMPPHIFEVGLKVNTKVYLDVLKSVVIPWCNQVTSGRPWVWQQDTAPAHKSKETQAWLQKECYDFIPFSHCLLLPRPELTGLLRLVIRREHRQHDLPQHQSQPDRRHPVSIRRAPAGACGRGMLPVPDPYRGGDWGWRRLYWIDVSSTT